jgi:hypothetical protein
MKGNIPSRPIATAKQPYKNLPTFLDSGMLSTTFCNAAGKVYEVFNIFCSGR